MTTRGILNVPAGQMNPAELLAKQTTGKGRESFGSVMKTQLNNTVGNDKTAVKAETKGTEKVSNSKESDYRAAAETPAGEIRKVDSQNQTAAAEKTEISKNSLDTAKVSDDQMPDQGEIQMLSETVAVLFAEVAQMFNLTPEELRTELQAVGAEPVDLLDPNTMTKLVMNLDGLKDASELLLNGESTEKIAALNDLAADFKSELADKMDKKPEELNVVLNKVNESETVKTEVSEKVEILFADERTVKTGKTDAKTTETAETEVPGKNEGLTDEKPVVNAERTENGNEGRENEGKSDFSGTHETERSEAGPRRESVSDLRMNPVESFIHNLERAAGTGGVQELQPEAVTMRDIVYQLSEQIKVTVTDTHQSMEMTLNPESLGKVFMNITNRDGVMTASFTTENQIAREAIESQLQILKDNIEAQGIRVEAIEVTVSDFNFAQSSNRQNSEAEQQNGRQNRVNGRRNLNLNDAELDASEFSEEERIAASVMEQNGNTVDYMA